VIPPVHSPDFDSGTPPGNQLVEDQAKGESPEHHERRARYYAESKGWDVREVYHLEAVSGKSVMGLPRDRTVCILTAKLGRFGEI
jgi:site-specific DNA recombinase